MYSPDLIERARPASQAQGPSPSRQLELRARANEPQIRFAATRSPYGIGLLRENSYENNRICTSFVHAESTQLSGRAPTGPQRALRARAVGARLSSRVRPTARNSLTCPHLQSRFPHMQSAQRSALEGCMHFACQCIIIALGPTAYFFSLRSATPASRR